MDPEKLLMLSLIIFPCKCLSGEQPKPEKFAVFISFFYPPVTNGLKSTGYYFNLSVNALTGVTDGIKGCEFAGLINMARYDMFRFQTTGACA